MCILQMGLHATTRTHLDNLKYSVVFGTTFVHFPFLLFITKFSLSYDNLTIPNKINEVYYVTFSDLIYYEVWQSVT